MAAKAGRTLNRARPRGRTPEVRREEASRKMLDAAFKLVARSGLESLSLAAIGEAAGFSRELPRYHYGSKDAFIEAMIDDCTRVWSELLQAPAERGLVGTEALMALFDSLFSVFDKPQFIRGRILLIFELAGCQSPRLRRKLNLATTGTRDRIARILQEDVAAGLPTSGLDLPALAALLAGAYRGVGYQWLMDPKSLDMDAVLRTLRLLFLQMLAPR